MFRTMCLTTTTTMSPCCNEDETKTITDKRGDWQGSCDIAFACLSKNTSNDDGDQRQSETHYLELASEDKAPKDASCTTGIDVFDGCFQPSNVLASAHVFGKQVFLPDDKGFKASLGEVSHGNVPPPVLFTVESICSLEHNASIAICSFLDDKPTMMPQNSIPKSHTSCCLAANDPNRPARKDVCFGLINHPGTKNWRSTVDNLALQHHRKWSNETYEEVLLQLDGCKFWICGESSSKCRQCQDWRVATDEEISDRTKQRFRDCQKQAVDVVPIQRRRGRPPKDQANGKKRSSPMLPTAVPFTSSCTYNVNNKLNNAIEACLQAIDEAQRVEPYHECKKLKLSIPLVGTFEGLHAVDEKQLLLLQSLGATQSVLNEIYGRLTLQKVIKLAEARQHFVSFVTCLTDCERLANAPHVEET